jgi:fibronectin type 3 domain-containing protein
VDRGLEPKTRYAYQISSITANGTESKTTDAYIVQTLPRIVPIDFVQAISGLPNSVKLVWKPHQDKRVGYYRIEKYNTLLNEWILLKTINERLQVEYVDTGLDNNSSYKYRIKAFSFDDVEAAPSKVVVGKTKPLPANPSNVRASNGESKRIVISWNPSSSDDVVKYEIQRSTFKAFGYEKIKEVNANTTEYIDTTDTAGKTYYYKVIAIDKDGLESSPEPVQGMSFNDLNFKNSTKLS